MNKKNEDYPDVDRIGESAMELPEASVPVQQGPRTLESLRASLQIVGDITAPFKEWETT